MSSIHFTKMHGLGNDFAVINGLTQKIAPELWPMQRLSHRHLGIGFDQMLILRPAKAADFYCQIINADGSEAEQCGNGLRCVARYIVEEKLSDKIQFTIETKAGVFAVDVPNFETIEVTMGEPKISALAHQLTTKTHTSPLTMSIISMGNPHAILTTPAIENADVLGLGAEIESHADFPQGINVGFMEVVNKHHIRLRTFERGVGETFACGSNACAAVVAGIKTNWLSSPVQVELLFGSLFIEWQEDKFALKMTGSAARVYQGSFAL